MSVIELQEPEVQQKARPVLSRKSMETLAIRESFFKDVLLEVDGPEKRRRRWAATTSVVFQSLMLGVLLVIPLMFTEALPKTQLLTFLVAPPPPPPPPPPAASAPPVQVIRHVQTDILDGRLRSPSRIPQKVQMIQEEEAPPPLSAGTGVVGGVPGGIPGGQIGGVIGGILSSTANTAVIPKMAPPKRVRVSQGVTAGMLIRRVEPPYPILARQARIQGEVILNAVISKEGAIENLQVESGHPLLIPAAIEAVKQWRYRPFMVSGEPVEVETRVTVTFRFAS
jgi:protein TonB